MRLLSFILLYLTACLYMSLFTAKLVSGVEVFMRVNHVNLSENIQKGKKR